LINPADEGNVPDMAAGSAMTVFETISARRSIRAFQDRPVEPLKLAAVLDALVQAPSAGNCQAYQVFVIRTAALKNALARAALGQDFLAQAPVVLVFCTAHGRTARYGERGRNLYSIQDATTAAAYAQLAATAQGLGTCWVGAFNEDTVSRFLQLSADLRPIILMPLGYANESPPRPPRRPVAEAVQELAPPS
jgi:nitroreductase